MAYARAIGGEASAAAYFYFFFFLLETETKKEKISKIDDSSSPVDFKR